MLPTNFHLITSPTTLANFSVGMMLWRKICHIRQSTEIIKLIIAIGSYCFNSKPSLIKSPSLEKHFFNLLNKCNMETKCTFDYLVPNEGHPENIKEHLALSKPGLIVSVGSERSFFNLIFSDPKVHQGMVILDVNPHNKAYVDFNTLLLRISKNKEEYISLSTLSKIVKNPLKKIKIEDPSVQSTITKRIRVIKEKIHHEKDLSKDMRNYYLKNLKSFALVYFSVSHIWKNKMDGGRFTKEDVFATCRYYQNDIQFNKLKSYAKTGKIISVVGDINHLNFFNDHNISIVDTSNIIDYTFINLETASYPRVIITRQFVDKTAYHSYTHDPLTLDEKNEFIKLVKVLKKLKDSGIENNSVGLLNMTNRKNVHLPISKFNYKNMAIYCREGLNNLREIIDHYVFQFDSQYYCLLDSQGLNKINRAPQFHLNALCKWGKIKNHLDLLVTHWTDLTPSVYLKFKEIEGWKEAFFKNMSLPNRGFYYFLKKCEKEGVLKDFITWFGASSLLKLSKTEAARELILSYTISEK